MTTDAQVRKLRQFLGEGHPLYRAALKVGMDANQLESTGMLTACRVNRSPQEPGGPGRIRSRTCGPNFATCWKSIPTFPTKVPSDSLGRIGSLKRTSDKSLFPMALGSCSHRITHQLRPINMNGRSILAVTSSWLQAKTLFGDLPRRFPGGDVGHVELMVHTMDFRYSVRTCCRIWTVSGL